MDSRWEWWDLWSFPRLGTNVEWWGCIWTIRISRVFVQATTSWIIPNAIFEGCQFSCFAAAAAAAAIFLCFTNGLQKYLSFQINFLAQPYISKIMWGIRKKIWKNSTNNISQTYLALNQHWSKIDFRVFIDFSDFRVYVVITTKI